MIMRVVLADGTNLIIKNKAMSTNPNNTIHIDFTEGGEVYIALADSTTLIMHEEDFAKSVREYVRDGLAKQDNKPNQKRSLFHH